jgi:drug/metabolite transporter (DMT)-like permease
VALEMLVPGIRVVDDVSDRVRCASILTISLIGLLWGLNWPAVKFMLTEMPPLTIRAVAFPIAALLLAIIGRAMGHRLRPSPRDHVAIMVTGLLIIFGFNILTVFGQLVTETSKAAIIAFTMPALTAVIAAIFLGERLGVRILIALTLGMAGLGVLASEDFTGLMAKPLGPAIMLLAALSWALGTVALKARRWSLSPLALTIWFFVVSSIFCWPLVFVFEPPWEQNWPTAPVLWTLAFHVLGPMVICYALWTKLVGKLPATVAAIATLMTPVVGVSSSIVFLGDPLTWQKLVSLLMILASILVTLKPAAERDRNTCR